MPVHSESPLASIITPADEPDLVYVLQPNLQTNFGHRLVRTNGAGMRASRDYTPAPPPGTRRIVGIGDSGMFGWGVEQGENYLDVLAATLAQRSGLPPVEVLNGGTPGYNTQLELAWLRHRGLAFRPDIVILGWCENDFYLPYFFITRPQLPHRRLLLYDLLFHRDLYAREIGNPVLGDRESTRGKDGKVDLEQVPDAVPKEQYVENVTQALRALQDLGRQHGFHVLVFGPLRSNILEIVQAVGLPYCNTVERIGPHQYPAAWAVHAMHPHPEGHRVLGELLADDLQARGWLTP